MVDGKVCQFKALCFGLGTSSPGVYIAGHSGIKVGTSKGYATLALSRQLAKSLPLIIQHGQMLFKLCQNLGIVINW